MAVNFLLLAIFCAISERSREHHRNRAVPIAALNLLGRRLGMDTWRTTSASHGGTRERIGE